MVDTWSTTPPDSTSDPVDTTPDSFEVPKDARKSKDAGKYPLYYSHKSRSGHVFNMDDSPGAESVTVQHRSGSAIQFMPDGAVVFTNRKNKLEVTFGASRMVVTGAYDVVVQDGGSLKVDGDYETTIMGDMNTTIAGDYNMTAKNMNTAVRGNMDTAVKGNQTTKVAGNSEHASEGRSVLSGDGGIGIASSADGVGLQAATDVAITALGGKTMLESSGNMSVKAGGEVGIDGTQTYIQSGRAVTATFNYTKDA